MRSLAPHSKNLSHKYYKTIERFEGEELLEGEIASYFDQPGGGTQYVKYKSDGTLYSIEEMIENKWIEDITAKVLSGEVKIK